MATGVAGLVAVFVVLFAASVVFVLLLGASLNDAFELFESVDGVGDVVSCQCFSLVFGEGLFVMAFRELAEFSQLLLSGAVGLWRQYGGRDLSKTVGVAPPRSFGSLFYVVLFPWFLRTWFSMRGDLRRDLRGDLRGDHSPTNTYDAP